MGTPRAAKKAGKASSKKSVETARARRGGLDVEAVARIALALPGVEEGTSYGTRAWKVKKHLVARLKEDGVTLAVPAPFELREALMASDPETFFITDHYLNYPMVLVRLVNAKRAELAALLRQAWDGSDRGASRKKGASASG